MVTALYGVFFLIYKFHDHTGGNAEAEYYRAENAVVSNSTLKIIAKQQEFGGRAYTSARIRSLGLVDVDLTQPFLRLEARIKVPAGKGMWPAFWMLPSNYEVSQWPLGGEIDIMEFIGREPNNVREQYMNVVVNV